MRTKAAVKPRRQSGEWMDLQRWLKTADEPGIEEALQTELKGKARAYWIERLYGTYARLREKRERRALRLS